MDEKVRKEFNHWGELARTFIAIIGVLTMIGTPTWKFWLGPMLVASVSTAMAEQLDEKIDRTVAAKLAPATAGIKAIIQGNINSLSERIDKLTYKRDFQRDSWTEMDRDELYKLTNDLKVQQGALSDILRAELNSN